MPILTATDPSRRHRTLVSVHSLAWVFLAAATMLWVPSARSVASALELIPAVYDGDYRRVETALAWGADANGCKPDGFTPLMRAVSAPLQERRGDFVKLLLAHGAEVNKRDAHGRTALGYVFQDPETARLLKRYGARE